VPSTGGFGQAAAAANEVLPSVVAILKDAMRRRLVERREESELG
jgi:hypothetical protein